MSWRIRITHTSRYDYAGTVLASYNEARMTPLTTNRQLTHDGRVEVQPVARPSRYIDYWGTVVDAFDLHQPHQALVVTASSVVETSPPPPIQAGPSWAELGETKVTDRYAEYLAPTAFTAANDTIRAAADELRSMATPAEAGRAAIEWVRDRMIYEGGTTIVSTSAAEAVAAGSGVCQDFAHVALALLRSLGIPARYVSGYLHPAPDAGLGDTIRGESHAWVDLWDGDWVGNDATNGVVPGERHVVVARGRDYADVTPLKGVVHGGGIGSLDVRVGLTRMG